METEQLGLTGGRRSGPRFNPEPRPWLRTARPWHRFAYLIRALPEGIALGIQRLDLKPGDQVLDFGCADQPYRGLLPDGVGYTGADLAGNPMADLVVTEAGRLPVPDDSFDAILSTQVLEHVAEPRAYMAECFRVLRRGGRLLLTTHGMMVLHPDPIDYWRWTSDGLRHEVDRAGLRVLSLDGITGLAATAVQLFQDATLERVPARLRKPYTLLMQTLMSLCDRLQSDRSRSYNACVFAVVAEKPAPDHERPGKGRAT